MSNANSGTLGNRDPECVTKVGMYVAQSLTLACSMQPRCVNVPVFLCFQASISDEKMHKLSNACVQSVCKTNGLSVTYIRVLQVKCVKQCFTEYLANEEGSGVTTCSAQKYWRCECAGYYQCVCCVRRIKRVHFLLMLEEMSTFIAYVAQSTLSACSMQPRCADVLVFLYFQ